MHMALRLSEGELECKNYLNVRNVPYHIVYDQPSLLRALGHKEYRTMPNAASVK